MRFCELRAAMLRLSRALEPSLLPLSAAKAALVDVTAIKNMAAVVESRLAARIAAASEWERAGFASPEAWLAHHTGTSTGKAKEAMATAQRLEQLSSVAAAAKSGELSAEQTAMIAEAAAANPAAEQQLVAAAKTSPLPVLKDECAKAKRAADPDPEATYRRLREQRCLRFGRSLDGAAKLFGATTPEQLAPIKAAVEARANELFHAARRQGTHEPREAYLIDALEQICREWRDGGAGTSEPAPQAPQRARKSPGYLGLLRIDMAALVRGFVEGEELCEITGLGPIPVSVARQLLGESVLKLVITRGIDVANVTHLGRGPTAAQRIAMLWAQPGCDISDCARLAGIQHDHTIDWSTTHHTVLDELRRLCDHHHHLKTRQGWEAIDLPDGTVIMIPPTDPRHPGHPGHRP